MADDTQPPVLPRPEPDKSLIPQPTYKEFVVEGPDGKQYKIETPQGTTEQRALEYFKQNYSSVRGYVPPRLDQPQSGLGAPFSPEFKSPLPDIARQSQEKRRAEETQAGVADFAAQQVLGRPLAIGGLLSGDVTPENVAGAVAPGFGKATKAVVGLGLGLAARYGLKQFPAIETIINPAAKTAEQVAAEALVRQRGGIAARKSAQAEHAFMDEREPFMYRAGKATSAMLRGDYAAARSAYFDSYAAKINALSEAEQRGFVDYVEGRSKGLQLLDRSLQPIADELKRQFEDRAARIAAMPEHSRQQFIEDYFPHFWKDSRQTSIAAADKWFSSAAAKQGSGASLKGRTVPTIADGMNAGLEPLITNPLEASMRYLRSMDHFIASEEIRGTGERIGMVQYFHGHGVGASGHPDSWRAAPDGWVALKGRGSYRADGTQAYAPAGFAKIYNRYISQGFHGTEASKGFQMTQNVINAITSFELGMSGFHVFTMANEGFTSEVARGLNSVVGGAAARDGATALRGLKTFIKSPLAPWALARTGKKMEDVYLNRTQGAPDIRHLVDVLTESGGRGTGKSHDPSYGFTAAGSFWSAFKRGTARYELGNLVRNARAGVTDLVGTLKTGQRPGAVTPSGFAGRQANRAIEVGRQAGRGVVGVGRQVGRVMETVAQPIFNRYIPLIKNGVFKENMADWIMMHPNATYEQQLAAGREILDSIDNRFGEMIQDNIFWDKTLKQTAQVAFRSYSWNMGSFREIGGGAADIAAGQWTPRATYTIALPIAAFTLNAAYQYLKTGKGPESFNDLIAPRTGGTVPGVGSRGEVDERAKLPGYLPQVFGWADDPYKETANKIATGWVKLGDLLSNEDYQNHMVMNPTDSYGKEMYDLWTFVAGALAPISIKQIMKGQKVGGNIGPIESMMGITEAPAYLQDPEGLEHLRTYKALQDKRRKIRSEKLQERAYGTGDQGPKLDFESGE